jgi:4-hydroxybenzoate polyprenyltransferase
MQQDKASINDLVRADNWIYSKIPPLLAVGYAIAIVGEISFVSAFGRLFLLFVSIFSVAAYGHIFNDIFDIEQDAAIGKKNAMSVVPPLGRISYCLFFIISGFIPLLLLDAGPASTFLLIVNYLLPTFYSVPHIRLKERGLPGVLADALAAHTVPILFITLSLVSKKSPSHRLVLWIAVAACIWSLFAGLRGIIVHQVLDRQNDRRANVVTFAGARRRRNVRRLVLRFFYPCELVGIVGFVCLVLPYAPVLAVFVGSYILGEFAKMKLGWRLPLFYPERPTIEAYLPLLNNEFYEVWLPCALAVQLTFVSLSYCLLLLIHVVLFRRIIRERVVILGRLVRDLENVFWRGANE